MNPLDHQQDRLTYLGSAYKIYFFHFREPFNENKTSVLQVNAFWAWFSYLGGVAILLGLLVIIFNAERPLFSIFLFVSIWLFLRPLLAALISMTVRSFQRNNHVSL